MNRKWLACAAILLAVVLLVGVGAVFAQSAMPSVTGTFYGQFQYADLSYINVGDITLILNVNDVPDWPGAYEDGALRVVMSGEVYTFTNWATICPGGGASCFLQWNMNLPEEVTELYMGGNPIEWVDVGPWHVNAAGTGLYRPELTTTVGVWISSVHMDAGGQPELTELSWSIFALPRWVNASASLHLAIDSPCKTLGGFEWEMPYLQGALYGGTTVFTQTPTADIMGTAQVSWTLTHQGSNTVLRSGTTTAPACEPKRLYLPLITN